jgi:hypothetical protein
MANILWGACVEGMGHAFRSCSREILNRKAHSAMDGKEILMFILPKLHFVNVQHFSL